MNAQFIQSVLEKRHDREAWIFAVEVHTSTGYNSSHRNGPGGIRRIDAFAMALWPSLDFVRIAYEIKVSRSDWVSEINNPMKRVQAWALSNEFWFAVADDIYEEGDFKLNMAGCGLLVVLDDGSTKTIQRARKRKHIAPMPAGFIASLMRCVRDIKHLTN